jgi:hypothetical protein
MGSGGGAAGGADGGMAAVANRIIQDTEGRGDATMQDPYLTAVLKRLDDIQAGKDLPYTDAVKSQITARHGDMGAAAEAANAEDLREATAANGGSMSDPSARARLSQGTQQRQAENLAFAGDLNTKATLENFNARNDASRAIAATRLPQLGEANGQYNLGAQYHSRYTTEDPHVSSFQYQPAAAPAPAPRAPSYQFGGGAGGGSSAPSPWASSNGGSVWAGSGIPNPDPVYGGSHGSTTQGTAANPVYALQDPYGGEAAPNYNFNWMPPGTTPANPNRALIYPR